MLVEPRGAPTRPRLGREWSDEFDDAVRGLASGFLIGIPWSLQSTRGGSAIKTSHWTH